MKVKNPNQDQTFRNIEFNKNLRTSQTRSKRSQFLPVSQKIENLDYDIKYWKSKAESKVVERRNQDPSGHGYSTKIAMVRKLHPRSSTLQNPSYDPKGFKTQQKFQRLKSLNQDLQGYKGHNFLG